MMRYALASVVDSLLPARDRAALARECAVIAYRQRVGLALRELMQAPVTRDSWRTYVRIQQHEAARYNWAVQPMRDEWLRSLKGVQSVNDFRRATPAPLPGV